MIGSARTRGFDGPPAEVHATTIRNPRGGSDGTRTYLLRHAYQVLELSEKHANCATHATHSKEQSGTAESFN